MIEAAFAYLLLFGGLAVLIFLLSLLSSGIEALGCRRARPASGNQDASSADGNQRNPIAAAINAYQQKRDALEWERTGRELATIKVLAATGGVALIAAGAAIYSAWIFQGQLNAMNDEQLAWIAPLSAQFIKPVPSGQDVGIAIHYLDPGRSPALNVNSAHRLDHIKMPDLNGGEFPQFPRNTTCISLGVIPGGDIVYPGTPQGYYQYTVYVKSVTISDRANLLDLEYVQGCFAYQTMGHTHHSPWCFYLNPIKGKDVLDWPFVDCPNGHEGQD